MCVADRGGKLAQLSVAALLHAQALGELSVGMLADRLYVWNRLPASASRRAEASLVMTHNAAVASAAREWIQVAMGPWVAWRPRLVSDLPESGTWKLYVSPPPTLMPDAVRAAFAALTGLNVIGLKYAGDPSGLLRPDKLVAHFGTRPALEQAACRLARTLAGCPVHGVPFTADIGAGGLLSWGLDPPRESGFGVSWRSWVTRRLAEGLVLPATAGLEPWQRALQLVADDGIDPSSWAPAPDIWTRRADHWPRAVAAGAGT